jgi:hypothetical protein
MANTTFTVIEGSPITLSSTLIPDELKTQLGDRLKGHLDELNTYIVGKNSFGRIANRKYEEIGYVQWGKAVYDIVGEAGMFIMSTLLTNADSSLENKIKNSASRKATTNTTMSLTQDVLSKIVFPRITEDSIDQTLNVELDGAFRISYK